jgi:hypothetical protein
MSGMLRYRFRTNGTETHVVNVLYHHGAWGGKKAKGYLGAIDWARNFDGWDVFVFGHCHQVRLDVERRRWYNKANKYCTSNRYIQVCGTYLEGEVEDYTTYSELKGLPPTAIMAPLFRFRPVRGGKVEVVSLNGDI